MPNAARVGDPTPHPGIVAPPGVPTVLINGMPAATVAASQHICSFPPPAVHPPTPFVLGSIDGAHRREPGAADGRHVRVRSSDPHGSR